MGDTKPDHLKGLARVVIVALIMSACGSGTTRTTGSPTSSPPSPSAAPSSGPQPTEVHHVLNPGVTYHTTQLEPEVTFTLRDTWWLEGEDAWSLIMTPGFSYQSEENLVFLDVERVFEPSNQRVPVKAPRDLVAWFVHHPGLEFIVKPHPVEIGGVRATEFDVRLGKGPLCPSNPNLPPGTRCWLIAPVRPGNPFSPEEVAMGPPFGVFTSDRGSPDRNRFDILDVNGHHLLIGYADYPETFNSTVRRFEELIQTVRFG
jgi:hypothetical protein